MLQQAVWSAHFSYTTGTCLFIITYSSLVNNWCQFSVLSVHLRFKLQSDVDFFCTEWDAWCREYDVKSNLKGTPKKSHDTTIDADCKTHMEETDQCYSLQHLFGVGFQDHSLFVFLCHWPYSSLVFPTDRMKGMMNERGIQFVYLSTKHSTASKRPTSKDCWSKSVQVLSAKFTWKWSLSAFYYYIWCL